MHFAKFLFCLPDDTISLMGKPPFPLYWIQDPVGYLSWSRSSVTEDDKKMFDILDQIPR